MAHRTPEYSHRLVPTNNAELERKIEFEAIEVFLLKKKLAEAQSNPDLSERAIKRVRRKYENRRDSLGEKCMKLFRVVGSDLKDGTGKEYGYDEALLRAIAKSLSIFDPDKGKFVHLVRRIAKQVRNEFAAKEDAYQRRVSPMTDEDRGIVADNASPLFSWGQLVTSEENESQDDDDFEDDECYPGIDDEDEASDDSFVDSSADERPDLEANDASVKEELASAARANVAFAQFLALVVGFLEHKEDLRDHTQDKKLYLRMFFTESMTRIVKECPVEEECQAFEPHENEVVGAMELPFQDVYMDGICRTIRSIWHTNLKEGFGEIIPHGDPRRRDRNPWHLPADVFRDYFLNATGQLVSRVAITNQRNNYKKLCGPILIGQ